MNAKNKNPKKLWQTQALFLLITLLFVLSSLSYDKEIFKADVTGLCLGNQTGTTCSGHAHNWETPSNCSTCGGDHIIDTSTECPGCRGKGYRPNSITSPGQESVYYSKGNCGLAICGGNGSTHYHLQILGCTTCGGSGQVYYYSTKKFTVSTFSTNATKSSNNDYKHGSGTKNGTADCSNCYASGTYKGKNTRCKNATWSGCGKGAYGAWDQTGICYTDACTPVYGAHAMNGSWNSDANSHWQQCIFCYGTMGTALHDYGTEWTYEGYRYQTCSQCFHQKCNGAITYTITYHGNGATGGTTASSSHTYDISAYLTENAFYKTGYTFQGWTTASDSTTVTYNNGQAISNLTKTHLGNVNLYAVWQPNSYIVTFHPNGGTNGSLSSITTRYGTSDYYSHGDIVPSRIGYTFLGWYTAIEDGTQVYDSQGVCVNGTGFWENNTWAYADNISLYAHWQKNIYTVTYDGNGGTVTTDSANVSYGDPISLSEVKSIKEGYVFTGWNTSANAKEPLSSYTMPADNLTLYAIYSIPISDVKDVYLFAWPVENTTAFRNTKFTQIAVQELQYTYSITNLDLAALTGSTTSQYAILSTDHAGNYSILDQSNSAPPLVSYYIQTVHHYKYDITQENWIWFDTTSELKVAGETFTPAYLATLPEGYTTDHIDEAYIVNADTTTSAYYTPITYQVTFDPNGGTISPTSKEIIYQDVYGSLPTPQREGYTFTGWYTAKTDGSQIISSTKYETPMDTTLYAHWQINNHSVIYDYWTNGGESVSLEASSIPYGAFVDLDVNATKYGWTFIGWSTSPDETTPLDSITMGDEDLFLYAIYKKEISATFIDGSEQNTKTTTITIYNRETECKMPIPDTQTINDWIALGWSMDTTANAAIHTSGGSEYRLSDDATFYGCYVQDIYIYYDTNGSSDKIPFQTEKRYFNAAGNYKNPTFTLAQAPTLPKHTFVHWEERTTTESTITSYNPKEHIIATNNIYLVAKWDAHPELEAYDRYFTLKEARNSEITIAKLLEKVFASDKEDGILSKENNVIIKNYRSEDFTSLTTNADLPITYQVSDNFGNLVEKTVTIHIVDTTVSQSAVRYYARFISPNFFMVQNNFVSNAMGGLESNSIWRTNNVYKQTLEQALQNTTPIHTFSFSKDEL